CDQSGKLNFIDHQYLWMRIKIKEQKSSFKCAIELSIADIIHSHGRAITLSELVLALDIQPTKNDCSIQAHALSLSSWFKGTELTLWGTVHGIKFWEFLNQNPGINQRFNEAMASDSEIMTSFVVKAECKQIFEGLGSLVDVGGGNGSFSRIISEAFPGIKCTVLDLPHVVANLPETDNLKYIADAFLFKVRSNFEILKFLNRFREYQMIYFNCSVCSTYIRTFESYKIRI
ncbi:hypothetical protein CICLE_v10006538mg, partial [Citrus x clementina]